MLKSLGTTRDVVAWHLLHAGESLFRKALQTEAIRQITIVRKNVEKGWMKKEYVKRT